MNCLHRRPGALAHRYPGAASAVHARRIVVRGAHLPHGTAYPVCPLVHSSAARTRAITVQCSQIGSRSAQPEPIGRSSGSRQDAPRSPLVEAAFRTLGIVAVVVTTGLSMICRPALAYDRCDATSTASTTTRADVRSTQHTRRNGRNGRSSLYTGIDLADSSATDAATATAAAAAPGDQVYVGPGAAGGTAVYSKPGRAVARSTPEDLYREQLETSVDGGSSKSDRDLQRLLQQRREEILDRHPELRDKAALQARLQPKAGVPLSYDEVMKSMVYDPADVPTRKDRGEVYEQIDAIMNQYDNEDFELGIKQFMIEQAVQKEMEEGDVKASGAKDYESKLAEQLFADEDRGEKERLRTADIADDAWTTEVAEEYLTLFGDAGALRSAWRVQENLTELSYTQFWYLIGEGHMAKVHYYGPERNKVLALTKTSAPGGERICKVVLPPDPELFDHLVLHGVEVVAGEAESQRVGRAFIAQIIRYTFPFVFISFLFWLLHTWILDPMPNGFRRREFIRYRREILHVGSKLNFRSPARQVKIDTEAPDFISWDDINGIDEVKKEIEEIIDYLKNPALLRLRGVARIGGVLLAGSPGTGKTLLAKAIAAESGVRMFTCSGTDFYDVYTGVGARRIRETFDKLRNFAPAILFVDEFDALGAARGAAASGDESANIINELLVQMDGFEDNRGIVVLGATNRPGAIDSALIRPGRFDRIIYMPLPDATGRAKILQVHARNKAVDPNINWYEVARAMAGFTGADCMGLMQRAARMAARQGRDMIVEEDIYAAMENKAVEAFSELTKTPQPGDPGMPDPIPSGLRKSVAVYEAAKALTAYITPEYDEIARVSVCPYNIITGYTLFVEDEDRSVDAILTRSDMEAHMVVNLAGRCAEKLVLGESEVTGLGVPDMFHANMIAREMVLSAGMGKKMGPVDLQHLKPNGTDSGSLLRSMEPGGADEQEYYYHSTDMSTEEARVALAECLELLEAAEAKCYYGLAVNWKPLNALVDALLERGVLQGKEVAHILETNGIIHFPDPYIVGFGWDTDGELNYPFRPDRPKSDSAQPDDESEAQPVLSGLAAKTWYAGTERDAPRDKDGKFKYGWHWNSPYSIKRDLPDWFMKEVERYAY